MPVLNVLTLRGTVEQLAFCSPREAHEGDAKHTMSAAGRSLLTKGSSVVIDSKKKKKCL